MSNIEELVKAAIAEFGERAHERFEDNLSFDYSSNSEIYEHILDVQLKNLPELFAHDVKIYGDNAYQMWQLSHEDNENNGDYYWITCTITLDFNLPLKYRRKTSAELPFDLERAKAGDVVEALTGDGEWLKVSFMGCTNEKIFVKWLDNTGSFFRLNELDRLRMKFPKKVQS